MNKNFLVIFVEGPCDKLFVEKVLKTEFEKKGTYVQPFEYAGNLKKAVEYINTLEKMKKTKNNSISYVCIGDMDEDLCGNCKKQCICIDNLRTENLMDEDCLKKKIANIRKNKFRSAISSKDLIVVVREIESWYIAGLTDENIKKLKLKYSRKEDEYTHKISKEDFINMKPNDSETILEYRLKVLSYFDIDNARRYNITFDYFTNKYMPYAIGDIPKNLHTISRVKQINKSNIIKVKTGKIKT